MGSLNPSSINIKCLRSSSAIFSNIYISISIIPGLPLPMVGSRGGLLHGGQLHDMYPSIRGLALVDHARHLERGDLILLHRYSSWQYHNTTYCVLIYFLCLQKMDTIVSPTLDLAEIRPKDSDAAAHSKLTHI